MKVFLQTRHHNIKCIFFFNKTGVSPKGLSMFLCCPPQFEQMGQRPRSEVLRRQLPVQTSVDRATLGGTSFFLFCSQWNIFLLILHHFKKRKKWEKKMSAASFTSYLLFGYIYTDTNMFCTTFGHVIWFGLF